MATKGQKIEGLARIAGIESDYSGRFEVAHVYLSFLSSPDTVYRWGNDPNKLETFNAYLAQFVGKRSEIEAGNIVPVAGFYYERCGTFQGLPAYTLKKVKVSGYTLDALSAIYQRWIDAHNLTAEGRTAFVEMVRDAVKRLGETIAAQHGKYRFAAPPDITVEYILADTDFVFGTERDTRVWREVLDEKKRVDEIKRALRDLVRAMKVREEFVSKPFETGHHRYWVPVRGSN